MPRTRRKSDVHALRNNRADALKKPAKSGSRRKTISTGLVKPLLNSDGNTADNRTAAAAAVKYDATAKENFDNHDDNMTGTSHVSISSKRSQKILTPSKKNHGGHNNRGGDAGYFYKHLPTTPLHKLMTSARKKHHMTPSLASVANSQSNTTSHKVNTSYLSNSSASSAGDFTTDSSMNSSTDQAMMELKLALETSHVSTGTNHSVASSKANASSGSSSAGGSSDAMNRSVLSDTTELTASNFVFTASSKQCMLAVARSEKKQKRKEESEKQASEDSLKEAASAHKLPLQEVQVAEMMMEDDLTEQTNIAGLFQQQQTVHNNDEASVKPPTQKATEAESQDRSEVQEANSVTVAASMPPSSQETKLQQQEGLNTSLNEPRRPPLLAGPSPASTLKSKIQVSPKSLRKFTASLKRNRVQRQFERDQDIKKRLSMSARKLPLPPSAGMRGQNISRFSLGNASAEDGRQSLGSVIDQKLSMLHSAEESPGEQQWNNLSSRMAQSPFESKHGTSQEADPTSSPEADTGEDGADDTADIAFEYQQWMRDPLNSSTLNDSVSSVRNSESALMLRRLAQNKSSETSMDLDASRQSSLGMGSGDLEEPGMKNMPQPVSNEANSVHNNQSPGQASLAHSPFQGGDQNDDDDNASKDSVDEIMNDLEDIFNSSPVSQRNSSTMGSPAASSNGGQDRTNNSETKRKSPSTDNDASPEAESTKNSSALDSPPETRHSLLVRQAPNSASKLTLSRLSKKPRRVANPQSIQSPARNTRSASKQKPDTSMEKNLPAPSPARRSIGSSKTNSSPESIDSGVASRTSRRSSVTADLADIGGLFDFTSEFKDNDDDDTETQTARNQRRETANPSDFGEVMQFFEGQDSENRRSSAAAMPNGRRSSMFQSSLARLPEDSTVSEDTETLLGKSEANDSPEPPMEEGASKPGESPMSLASPKPARKVSSARKANNAMIDSPARNTRSASKKKKQEVAYEVESPRFASNESEGDATASVDLSGLMEGLSQLSPTSNLGSASKSVLTDHQSQHNGDVEANSMQADDGSGKKNSRSRYFLDTQDDGKDDPQDKINETIGSASKRGRSRYSLNSSSSSNEGEEDDNDVNDESNDVKTVDDDNTASLSDVGSVLGMLTDPNDTITSEAKRQRNSVSSEEDSVHTQKLLNQIDVEDTRETKRRKSLSLSREEETEDTAPEPKHEAEKEMPEESETASLGDIGDLLRNSHVAAKVSVSSETSPVQNDASETTEEITAERPMLLSANDSHVLSSALKKPGDNRRQSVSSARRTVNFKSPEAAEYNIGSVSSNLTPMLKSQAKALFKLPSTNEESCDMSISSSDSTLSVTSPTKESNEEILARDEVTVTLEMDMNQLMANLGEPAAGEETASNKNPASKDLSTNSSMESSPGGPSQLSQEDATVELESNLLGLLASTSEKKAVSEERPEMGEPSREAMSLSQNASPGSVASRNNQQQANDTTVELEDNVQGLLANIAAEGSTNEVQHANAEGSFDSTHELRRDSGENDSSIEISQEMTDAKSIASANAPGTDTGLSLRERQRLDFSSPTTGHSQASSKSGGGVEEDTIQLELDMATLIDTIGSRSEGNGFNHLDVSAIPLSSPSDQGTPSFRSEASDWSEKKQTEEVGASPGSAFHKPTNESTVQLEDNVQELLNNADALGAGIDDSGQDSVDAGHTKKESFTVELEDNMAMLLDANRTNPEQTSGTELDIDIQDTPGNNRSLRSRRSSFASHTFSLAPEGRLDAPLAAKTSEIDSTEMVGDNILVPSQDLKDQKQPEEVKLDLHYQELLDLASLSKPISNQFPDILDEFAEMPQKSATENLNSFLAEACDQLESHIDEIPDIEAEFRISLEEDSEKFLDLQQKLRKAEGTGSLHECIEKLGVGASESNNYAMAIWSKDMLTSIQEQRFPPMLESMQEVVSELEQNLKQIEDANNLLSSMADATVRRARRKSIKRRKVCTFFLQIAAPSHKTDSNSSYLIFHPFRVLSQSAAITLEDDIEDLEAEIAKAEEELQDEELRISRLAETKTTLEIKKISKNEIGPLWQNVGSSRAKHQMVESISRWESVRMIPASMSFKFLGSFPESCISLVFDLSNKSSGIRLRAKFDPSGYKSRAGHLRKLSVSAASFLKRKTRDIVAGYQKLPLQDPSDIGPLLRNLNWYIGRLEHLAVELSATAAEYESNLLFGGKDVALEVELKGCLATIELTTQYPFQPLKVRIDVSEGHSIKIKPLQRHLMKRVKPGYEYVTRLLDTMTEYLGTSK